MGEFIVTSAAQLYNNYTQTRPAYSLDLLFGNGVANGSTPAIDPADVSTQRFAVSMPSLGLFKRIKVLFESQTGGNANGTIDFRLYESPWGGDRIEKWDILYEKKNIRIGDLWNDSIIHGLEYANRVAYNGTNPTTNEVVGTPRNFLWVEIKPNDPTADTPLVRVGFIFQV